MDSGGGGEGVYSGRVGVPGVVPSLQPTDLISSGGSKSVRSLGPSACISALWLCPAVAVTVAVSCRCLVSLYSCPVDVSCADTFLSSSLPLLGETS